MSESPNIDLVLPVLNPSSDWVEETIGYCDALESSLNGPFHLIIVNDGSSDHSLFDQLVSKRAETQVVHLSRNKGKGAALRAGIGKAKGEVILFTDADFPYSIQSMSSVIDAVVKGSDVVLGYREQDYYASVPWFRKGLSELLRFVLKSVLRFPITDTQCGLKGMNQRGKEIFLQTSIDRFMVDMDFIKRAVKATDVSIQAVVVKLRPDVQFSKMGPSVLIREGFNFIRVIFS